MNLLALLGWGVMQIGMQTDSHGSTRIKHGFSGNRDGWGQQVSQRDPKFHYFENGNSVCARSLKTGGGYMSSTPHYPECAECLRVVQPCQSLAKTT
jgi:hypothetical protein